MSIFLLAARRAICSNCFRVASADDCVLGDAVPRRSIVGGIGALMGTGDRELVALVYIHRAVE